MYIYAYIRESVFFMPMAEKRGRRKTPGGDERDAETPEAPEPYIYTSIPRYSFLTVQIFSILPHTVFHTVLFSGFPFPENKISVPERSKNTSILEYSLQRR